MRVYRRLGQLFDDGMPLYLDDRSNVLGTRLLSKCRLGDILLMVRVAKRLKWPPCGARCLMCRSAFENVRHFMLECPALEVFRIWFRDELDRELALAGLPGQHVLGLLDSLASVAPPSSPVGSCWVDGRLCWCGSAWCGQVDDK